MTTAATGAVNPIASGGHSGSRMSSRATHGTAHRAGVGLTIPPPSTRASRATRPSGVPVPCPIERSTTVFQGNLR